MIALQTTSTEQQEPVLRLGQIGERLGITVTASLLASLGFEPVAREKAAMLYRAADFQLICVRLMKHIQTAMAAHGEQPA